MKSFLLLSVLFLPLTGHAADLDLFRIRKAILPENEIMLQARVSSDCVPTDIDFMYYVGVDSSGKAREVRRLSGMAEDQFRKRFQLTATRSDNAADCRNTRDCRSISVQSEEFGWVEHGLKDPSVVIRAEKQGGKCAARAYVDLNGKPAAIRGLRVNADNVSGLFKKTFHVISLEVLVDGQSAPIVWKCVRDCTKSEGLR